MTTAPGFVFPVSMEDAFDDSGQLTNPDVFQERDTLLEDWCTFMLAGVADDPTFTAVAGGATIPLARSFSRVPKILLCAGDDVGTPPVTYQRVKASDTTSSFKVKVYSGATEQTSGTYRIVYVAIGT